MSLTYNLTYIRHRFLLIHGIISLAYVSLYIVLVSQGHTVVKDAEAEKAALRMEESIQVVAAYCRQQHIQVNSVDDPLQTGLVGPEWSPITTTVGQLEAKRTTLNPGFASLVVSMLKKAGVQHGDQIAIGCSGSFPALLIASLSAAEAMDLQVRLIFSLGSSSYGATRPGFNLLHIFQLLKDHQFTSVQPLAISPGGDHDTGLDLEPETVDHIISQIRASGYPLLFESDLQKNLAKRWTLYHQHTDHPVKAFINCGGAWANLGESSSVLHLPPGLIFTAEIPLPAQQGMIHRMLIHHIPVIHLLYIKGLALKYNLPWDPVDITAFRSQPVSPDRAPWRAVLPAVLYLLYFGWILIHWYMLKNISGK